MSSSAERSFADIAADLALLDGAALTDLLRSATERGVPPELLAVERGILTAAELDIVQTLRRPRDVIPGYEVLGPLGYGGMGVVYRARQIALARTVALKTVLMDSLNDAKALARFELEARTLARLAHPHIVGAIDFGKHQGRLFFAMELVEGENVEQLIARRGPLDAYTACGLVRQAAAALAQAESQGVIHRDVKPSNMLLVERPAGFPLPPGLPLLKVADFGLALLTEATSAARLTTAHMAVGSPHYMSPEQLSGGPIDGRSDMYALGASLYHMLSGSPPWAEQSLAQVITAKLHHGLPPLEGQRPDLTPEVLSLLNRLTDRDPQRRFGGYEELMAALDALELTEPAVTATQPIPRSYVVATPRMLPHATTPQVDPLRTATLRVEPPPPPAPTPAKPQDSPEAGFDRRWLLAASVGLAALVAGGFAVRQWLRPAPPARPLVPIGSVRPLFAGKTLEGWEPLGGQWLPERVEDGALVIAGEDGTNSRLLPDWEHYRIQLSVALPSAKIASLAFGKGKRHLYYVDLSSDAARAGRQDAAGARTEFGSLTLTESRDFRHVQIERQAGVWWVFIDGQMVAWIEDAEPTSPLLILTADRGKAWFADVEVQELGPP